MSDNVLVKKKKKKKRWPLVLVFLIGFGILAYPLVSRLYYENTASSAIYDFESNKSELDEAEIERRLALAYAYNDAIVNPSLTDPYGGSARAEGLAEYARMLEIHEKIGYVRIPKINVKIPMYAGTAEVVLQKGVGHLEGTSLPVGGNSTHAVLTAHRGLPNARLFSELNELEIGDKFYVHTIGGVLAYQVNQVKVIEPHEFQDLMVVPGHDYVTLLTCTPYMINSHRLLVRGHRVDYVEAAEERLIAENEAAYSYKYAFFATLGVLFFVLLFVLLGALKRRKRRKRLAQQKSTPPPDQGDAG